MSPWNIILILFLIFLQASSQIIRASFNKTCGTGVRCDSRKFLTCTDDTCKCIKPDEMVYDMGLDKCVVLVGERCTYTAMEIITNATAGERWTEKLDCVPNAKCNEDGYCGCDEPLYFETPEGSCSAKSYASGHCTSDNQCRTDLRLTCQEGICSCDLTEAAFNYLHLTCAGIAGTECSKYDNKCVDNAQCTPAPQNYDYNLGRYISAWEPKCECHGDYIKSKYGLCLSKYGQTCGLSSHCHEDFSCIAERCSCPFPKHQYNVETSRPCISLVGGPCKEKVDDQLHEFKCVEKARCTNMSNGNDDTGIGIFECICQNGYIGSVERTCQIAHGYPCPKSGITCDKGANLVCKNGKCSCQDLEVYDEEELKCRGLVGAQCNPGDDYAGYCVDGAVCSTLRQSSPVSGSKFLSRSWNCRCNSTSEANSDRTCSSKIGTKEDKALDEELKQLSKRELDGESLMDDDNSVDVNE